MLRGVALLCSVLGLGITVALLLAPLDLQVYEVNGRAMGGREFARLFVGPATLLAVALSVAGWGLLRERPWAREALLAAVAAFAAAFTWIAHIDGTADAWSVAWRWLVLVILAAGYLYLAPSMRAYFDAVRQRSAGGGV